MPPKQLLTNQKSVIKRLLLAKDMADELLKERCLHLRTRNLDVIIDPKLRQKEKWRQNIPKHKGEHFDRIVNYAIRNLNNSEELLHEFEYVDLEGQSLTSANLLELRMLKVQKIIGMIEQHPEKYIPEDIPIDRNVRYKKATGYLSQELKSYPITGQAKELVDYLWGKRKINYIGSRSTKPGRPLTIAAVLNNTTISSRARLVNVIDNFNSNAGSISAKIKRERSTSLIQLEVEDEFQASP